jgi:lactoylglutathione lyase
MKKVTGIGGIFFKCEDPTAMKEWYRDNLGVPVEDYGATFTWRDKDDPEALGYTVWSPFDADTDYFDPGESDFMVNFRVDDLDGMIEQLKAAGVKVLGDVKEYEYGRFGWVMDPEGNKIELWEPPADGKELFND